MQPMNDERAERSAASSGCGRRYGGYMILQSAPDLLHGLRASSAPRRMSAA
jgi:hypothetical protein